MPDITPNVVVSMPSQLFTMAGSFKAASNGSIYIGQIDTDPLIPANQVQVYVENEDGSYTVVPQPIKLNVGGYPVYQGQIAKFVTVEGQSMTVLDAFGAQQFYFPNVLKYDPDQFEARLMSDEIGQGGSLVNAKRGVYLDDGVRGNDVRTAVSSTMLKPHEYIDLISTEDKNGSDDVEKWNWDAVFEKLIDYALTYRPVTVQGINPGEYFCCIGIELPPGVFPVKKGLQISQEGAGTGISFKTLLVLKGQGMFNSLINVQDDNVTLFDCKKVSVLVEDVGIRFDANNGRAFNFGDENLYLPSTKCYLRRVLISGACDGIYSRHIYDSSFEQVYIINGKLYTDGVSISHGMYFGYTNSLDSNGLHDSSNHVTIRDCQIETISGAAGRGIMFAMSGYDKTYAHHNFRVENNHIETHDRTVVAGALRFVRTSFFLNNNFAQTGSESVDPKNVLRLENCYGVSILGGKITTNNLKTSYDPSYDKLISILGDSSGIILDNGIFFSTPYVSLSSYNRNFEDTVVNYSTADNRRRSFVCGLYSLNDVSFRICNDELFLTDPSLISRRFGFNVKNNVLTLNYNSDVSGLTPGIDIMRLSNGGDFSTYANVKVGSVSSGAVSRSVQFVNNGDQTTVMSSLTGDNAGRLYLNALQNAVNFVVNSTSFSATVANTLDIGSAAIPMKNGYFQNAITVVSTRDHKPIQDEIPDDVLDVWSTINIKRFKYDWAINEKGEDNARWHVGYIVEDIIEAFSAAGLDATEWAIVVLEKWDSSPTIYDEDGNILQKEITAGSCWRLNASECSMLDAALEKRRIKK